MRRREVWAPEAGDVLFCVLRKDAASIPWVARAVVTRLLEDARQTMDDPRKRGFAPDASVMVEPRLDADVVGGCEDGEQDAKISTVSWIGGHLSPFMMRPTTSITDRGVSTGEVLAYHHLVCDGPYVRRSDATRRAAERCEQVAADMLRVLRKPDDPAETRCVDATCPLDHRAIAESMRARARELYAASVEQRMSEPESMPGDRVPHAETRP